MRAVKRNRGIKLMGLLCLAMLLLSSVSFAQGYETVDGANDNVYLAGADTSGSNYHHDWQQHIVKNANPKNDNIWTVVTPQGKKTFALTSYGVEQVS